MPPVLPFLTRLDRISVPTCLNQFAETFKYYYLLFSPPSHLSLDDYVLSTEAHPFIYNPSINSGSQGMWDSAAYPDEEEVDEMAGGMGERKRPEGTATQKWGVYKEMKDWGMLREMPKEEEEAEKVVVVGPATGQVKGDGETRTVTVEAAPPVVVEP